ncbi:hypothetical protein COW98_04240 [Candidatus Roizmanbacteria bacterium CG22_combo_CG10-13_8_21_14_all_35_9]|uniref:Uncharacterized protein n=4 Tax=Candidatus Roizmaniibacteriota TaxID=1752723 RepID=A0A2M8F3F2_9BACT|nr:MAG: hypothetical protein COX47_03780 [Candidatus Roizmanbacteria bacterium CG23_combo_of_CG06-09_8_20_14_all_35_49]PIP62418.1 MAG: hypothetical protein COW98_04240 [Candidatus Roizmanbacteria bacterium CG22_combo_CG10-13_8_21_14_all_35_9]PIY71386.1 MAG: hypothetical protein COY88_00660 [Candidatus Roizmanbacteria bacterium CG_4_10_14_0_8_um_filter_35_28]PJC33812.1 MAG: hypothetical protein CO048_02255 [Candidatus Roizmanbacteria bacterium CG_4_9_14_0_2_um_filter_35_15]PJC82663.1 MAG: hypoth
MLIKKKGEKFMKKKKIIPKFKSLKEEAEYWDKNSLADHWDSFEDIDLFINLHKPKEETLILRVQKGLKSKLDKIAKEKGLKVSSLVRLWLTERIKISRA